MEEYGKLILCKPGGDTLGTINAYEASLKESLSELGELTFSVDKYINMTTLTPFYESITEMMWILYIDNKLNRKMYFIIDEEPSINIDATKNSETKSVTAHTVECDLQHKFLRNFSVNMGTTTSQEYLIYDDQGRNVNAYTYNTDTNSKLAIDYIQVDCRKAELCADYENKVNSTEFEFDGKTAAGSYIVKKDTDGYNLLKQILTDLPRVQKHLYYEGDSTTELMQCYIYTNDDVIAIDSKMELLTGLETLRQFYTTYEKQLSLIYLVLESAELGGWETWHDAISDELAAMKWNFEIDEQDLYSFFTSDFAEYAEVIMCFDRYNLKVGCRLISEYNNDEFDTGIKVSQRNLVNSVDISTSLEEGIKTKMYATGADDLGIEQVNFGEDFLIDFSYLVNTKNEYGDFRYGNQTVYDEYKAYLDEINSEDYILTPYELSADEKTILTETYGCTITDTKILTPNKRTTYAVMSVLYNNAMLQYDELTNRVPNDGCEIDYTSYQYDELLTSWKAYRAAVKSIENLFLTDYPDPNKQNKIYDTSNSIRHKYPDTTYTDDTDTMPTGATPINKTMYWWDYLSFYGNILPKVYESLKRWVSTDDNGYLLTKNGVAMNISMDLPDDDEFDYLESGNPEYLKDDDFLKTIDDWIYEWDLYGVDEIAAKLKAWQGAASKLYHSTFIEKDTIDTLYFYYDSNGKIQYTTSEPVESFFYLDVERPKRYDYEFSSLSDTEGESYTEDTTSSSTGWQTNHRKWLDYWGYDYYGEDYENTMTHRKFSDDSFKALGVCIQAQVAQYIRTNERTVYSDHMTTISASREGYKTFYSYATTPQLSSATRLILNHFTSSTDYSNENILITNLDTIVTKVKAQLDLFEDSENELSKLSQPQYSFSTELDNLFALEEFAPLKTCCSLGNFIYLNTDLVDDDFVKLRLISIEKNPLIDTADLTVEFSTMTKSLEGISDLAYLIDGLSGGSSSSGSGSSSSSSGTYGENDAEVNFSNNLLNALLSNNAVKTQIESIVADSVTAEAGIFNQLHVGNVGVSGDCLTAGTISSIEKNGDDPVSSLNLNDGTFSFANGGLTFDKENLTVKGTVYASAGEFSGELKAATGTFSGDLSAVGGTFGGTLDGADGNFTGELSAATGTFKGELSAATGSFSGTVTASNGKIGDWKIGTGLKNTDDTIHINPTELKYGDNFKVDASGNVTANSATFNNGCKYYGDINVNEKFIVDHTTGTTTINDTCSSSTEALTKANFTVQSSYYVAKLGSAGIDIKSQSGSDETFIGTNGLVCATDSDYDNDSVFGPNSITHQPVYSTKVTNASSLLVDAYGTFGTSKSSRRYKTDIAPYSAEYFTPQNLYDVQVVQFRYKDDTAQLYLGLIAEDVAEAYPQAAIYDKNGLVDNWSERELIPPMLALIQEQKKEIEELKARIEKLEQK